MSTNRLAWERIAGVDGVFHLSRHDGQVSRVPVHSHDFAELFWVESGEATHHSGVASHRIGPGDVVLVAPRDRHRFTVASGDFSMTNLAFPLRELHRLKERYFSVGGFPWDSPPPRLLRIGPSALARAERLSRSQEVDRLQADRLLIDVLVSGAGSADVPPDPAWLALALSAWRRNREAMERGVTGLAEMAGRSRGHVSRSVREATGRSATEYLNHIRLEEAAARLRAGEAILDVATGVGIMSLSHFYALFGKRFGVTPGRYRRMHH